MKLLYVNLSFYKYVYLIVLIVHMFFLCWAKFQLLKMSSMRCERMFYLDMACMDRLNVVEPFTYKFTTELSFTSSRTKTIYIYTDLFFISHYTEFRISFGCLYRFMSPNTYLYIILYRYCIHISYRYYRFFFTATVFYMLFIARQ